MVFFSSQKYLRIWKRKGKKERIELLNPSLDDSERAARTFSLVFFVPVCSRFFQCKEHQSKLYRQCQRHMRVDYILTPKDRSQEEEEMRCKNTAGMKREARACKMANKWSDGWYSTLLSLFIWLAHVCCFGNRIRRLIHISFSSNCATRLICICLFIFLQTPSCDYHHHHHQ